LVGCLLSAARCGLRNRRLFIQNLAQRPIYRKGAFDSVNSPDHSGDHPVDLTGQGQRLTNQIGDGRGKIPDLGNQRRGGRGNGRDHAPDSVNALGGRLQQFGGPLGDEFRAAHIESTGEILQGGILRRVGRLFACRRRVRRA
jgi:hypothetical protein